MSLLIIILISLIRGHSAQGGPDRLGICKLYSFTNRGIPIHKEYSYSTPIHKAKVYSYPVLKYDVFGTS